MADQFVTIEVDGLDDVLRDLRRLGDKEIPKAIRQANKDAAETVAQTAKVEVPTRSGRLQRSIRALATQRRGQVKAGSAVRVPYAGPIHFGWFRRHIKPNPFLYRAADRRRSEVFAAYEKQVNEAIAKFDQGGA